MNRRMSRFTTPMAVALLLCLSLAQAWAAALGFPFRVQDDNGALVAGASFAISGTTVALSTAGAAPTYTAVTVKSASNAASVAGVNVAIYDFGTGDYLLVYDAQANGDAYIPLSVSKTGSLLTGGNALLSLISTREAGNILATAVQTGDSYARIGANGAGLSAVGLTTGQNVATIGGQAPPANFNLMSVDGTGKVAVNNLPSVYPLATADETLLGSLAAMIAGTGASAKFTTGALANAPAGTGTASDPFGLTKTPPSGYAAGTWGAYLLAGVNINMAQTYDETQVGPTIAGALNGGRTEGFGKWAFTTNGLDLYASDNVTIIKHMNVSPTPTTATRN